MDLSQEPQSITIATLNSVDVKNGQSFIVKCKVHSVIENLGIRNNDQWTAKVALTDSTKSVLEVRLSSDIIAYVIDSSVEKFNNWHLRKDRTKSASEMLKEHLHKFENRLKTVKCWMKIQLQKDEFPIVTEFVRKAIVDEMASTGLWFEAPMLHPQSLFTSHKGDSLSRKFEKFLKSRHLPYEVMHVTCQKDEVRVDVLLGRQGTTTKICQLLYINEDIQQDKSHGISELCKGKFEMDPNLIFPIYLVHIQMENYYQNLELSKTVIDSCIKKCFQNIPSVHPSKKTSTSESPSKNKQPSTSTDSSYFSPSIAIDQIISHATIQATPQCNVSENERL